MVTEKHLKIIGDFKEEQIKMYRCKRCGTSSSAIKWNTRTKIKLDVDDVNSIENNDYGTYFYCPSCGKSSDREDIEETLDDECDNESIIIITKDEDVKWLLEEILKAGRYAEVDFEKITEVAKRNGYEINEDLDLIEIENV